MTSKYTILETDYVNGNVVPVHVPCVFLWTTGSDNKPW